MSYATQKAYFTTVLDDNDYTEVKNLLEFDESPMSYNHKYYVLKPEGFVGEGLSSNTEIMHYLFRLEVIYKNVNTTERDANFQLFLDLSEAIAEAAGFLGYDGNGRFVDKDNKHTIGTLTFLAGVEC